MIWLFATAQAAGYYSSDGGARATGRAGAFVAGADDLSAQLYNPAALSRVDRQLTAQFAGVHQQVVFDRGEPVDNSAAPMPIPAIGYAHRLGSVTLAFGAWSPYAPRLSFPDDGPQRFTLIDSVVLSGNVGPSVAWKRGNWSIGGSAAWTFVSVEQSLVAHVAPLSFQADEDPIYDVRTDLDLQDPFELTWNAGLLYDTGRWALGASYTPPVRFEPRGPMTVDFSKNAYYTGEAGDLAIIASETVTDEVVLDVVLPRVVRAGVLVRGERGELELAGSWEQWSSMPPLEVREVDLLIETTAAEDVRVTSDVGLPLAMQDAFSARVGGTLHATDRIDARAGLGVETSAVSSQYRSVFLPDALEVVYGLGGSWQATETLGLDLGWSQSIAPPHDLDVSLVSQVQIDPSTGAVGAGLPVGAGRFRSTTSMLAVGLNWTP